MEHIYEAPARVNLIGEHTDYTGGMVLPAAIPFTTRAVLATASDGLYHFESDQFPGVLTISPGDPDAGEKARGDWSDYPVGVLRQLQARGVDVPPFHLKLSGDVPLGAGLSSSASVEVATAVALLAHAGVTFEEKEIARLCQAAENDFVGSPCGIMDQFAVTACTAGHALLLNTGDLTYELLPLNTGALASCRIVIFNSTIRHSIADGDYGLRRREVEQGQSVLCDRFAGVHNLRDATLGQLEKVRSAMSPDAYRRCRHIISENSRVLEARAAMLAGDAARLGKVMTASHASERDDFACSTPEIDFLVETANAQPGCQGARLTGGGFGGCTVSLVETSAVDQFRDALLKAYTARFGLTGAVYVCEAVDGAIARIQKSNSEVKA